MADAVTIPRARPSRSPSGKTPPALPHDVAARKVLEASQAKEAERKQRLRETNEASVAKHFATEARLEAEKIVARERKPLNPLADCSNGTRTLYAYIAFLKERKLQLPQRTMSFTKDVRRVVVSEYALPNGEVTCAVLAFDGSMSKTVLDLWGVVVFKGESSLREFREWRESLNGITKRLIAKGWELKLAKEAKNGCLF